MEVVGASYGQPYGLFHGGESNARQRIYGVRTVRLLLGVRPKTFWEEEFDFFPQLLRGVGFEYGSLFFQWTWHTPEVPKETLPAVLWEGMDGSRLLSAPRGPLNLHQWPEDFANLLSSHLPKQLAVPGIVQWLELMPSQDWMCRSELMIPPLERLLAHPDYEVRMVTLSEYLEAAREHAEPRRYTMDDVFHGLSLGKNGDLFRRLSREAEQTLLTAEALSSLAGLFGRPYANWDVYPIRELEEAWRELLSAQHHDNDECEGLCGHIGRLSYERSLGLSRHVLERTAAHLAGRTQDPPERTIVFNPLGWTRSAVVQDGSGRYVHVEQVPAFGYRVLSGDEVSVTTVHVRETENMVALARGGLQVAIDRRTGLVTQIRASVAPEGLLAPNAGPADLWMRRGGQIEAFDSAEVTVVERDSQPTVKVERFGRDGAAVIMDISLARDLEAVDITYRAEGLPRPDPGFAGPLRTAIGLGKEGTQL